jgi:hypothetical protein
MINAFPTFITEIEGVDIDSYRLYSCSLEIIVTHGWPYSVLALLETIERGRYFVGPWN